VDYNHFRERRRGVQETRRSGHRPRTVWNHGQGLPGAGQELRTDQTETAGNQQPAGRIQEVLRRHW